jgi:hypothetical protein
VHNEKLDNIGVRLEHTTPPPKKKEKKKPEMLKCPAQKTGLSKSSAIMATQLLKFRPYKTAVIHAQSS